MLPENYSLKLYGGPDKNNPKREQVKSNCNDDLRRTTSDADYAVIVDDLQKSYKKVKVLEGVSFKVKKGSIFALLGPNGAGKTTIIRILGTLITADGGQASISGFDVRTRGHRVRRSIGLTGQYAAVDDLLSGTENLYMMGKLYRLSASEAKTRTKELLEKFDLADAAKRRVKTYSGGMRRRLDLAMSLIASPPVIFLDEPTTGLDPRSRLGMWDTVRKLARDGITILLTTQYMDEAENLADYIAVLDRGKIIEEGTVSELKTRVGEARVVMFFACENQFVPAQKALKGVDFRVDAHRRSICVKAENGIVKMKEILCLLEAENIHPDSIALQHPTLDDVFMTLTGHKAEETSNQH